ncbi:MAG TPA: hypothetical protein VGF58_13450 [Burkholderiales bacterium]|jgi:hypothetical protein
MERATHPAEDHAEAHPAPVARDPDLPTVSDATLMLFAGGALVLTLAALVVVAP